VRRQGSRRIETAADEQAQHAEQFEVVGRLSVDGGPCDRVDHAGTGILLDLVEAGEKVHSHDAVQFRDAVDVG
jgi:hypothetical protein